MPLGKIKGGIMNIEIQTEYKGHLIKWSDYNKGFTVWYEGVDLKKGIQTVEICQKYIDDRTKEKWARIRVYFDNGYNEYKEYEATSLIDGQYAWITNGERRSKERLSNVYIFDEEN